MLYIYSPSFCWHTPTPKIQKRLSRPLVQNGFFLFSHGFPAFLHLVITGYQPGSLPGWEFPGSLDPKIAARPNTPRRQRLFQEASLTEIRPHCIWNWPVIIYTYSCNWQNSAWLIICGCMSAPCSAMFIFEAYCHHIISPIFAYVHIAYIRICTIQHNNK